MNNNKILNNKMINNNNAVYNQKTKKFQIFV